MTQSTLLSRLEAAAERVAAHMNCVSVGYRCCGAIRALEDLSYVLNELQKLRSPERQAEIERLIEGEGGPVSIRTPEIK